MKRGTVRGGSTRRVTISPDMEQRLRYVMAELREAYSSTEHHPAKLNVFKAIMLLISIGVK